VKTVSQNGNKVLVFSNVSSLFLKWMFTLLCLFTGILMTVSRTAGENCRAVKIALKYCAYQKLRQLSARWRKYQSGCSYFILLVYLFLSKCLLYYLFTENLVIVSRRAGETKWMFTLLYSFMETLKDSWRELPIRMAVKFVHQNLGQLSARLLEKPAVRVWSQTILWRKLLSQSVHIK